MVNAANVDEAGVGHCESGAALPGFANDWPAFALTDKQRTRKPMTSPFASILGEAGFGAAEIAALIAAGVTVEGG